MPAYFVYVCQKVIDRKDLMEGGMLPPELRMPNTKGRTKGPSSTG
jgi:hypothetical protein